MSSYWQWFINSDSGGYFKRKKLTTDQIRTLTGIKPAGVETLPTKRRINPYAERLLVPFVLEESKHYNLMDDLKTRFEQRRGAVMLIVGGQGGGKTTFARIVLAAVMEMGYIKDPSSQVHIYKPPPLDDEDFAEFTINEMDSDGNWSADVEDDIADLNSNRLDVYVFEDASAARSVVRNSYALTSLTTTVRHTFTLVLIIVHDFTVVNRDMRTYATHIVIATALDDSSCKGIYSAIMGHIPNSAETRRFSEDVKRTIPLLSEGSDRQIVVLKQGDPTLYYFGWKSTINAETLQQKKKKKKERYSVI